MNVRDLHQPRPRELRLQMLIAAVLVVAGLAVSGAALFRIATDSPQMAQLAAPDGAQHADGQTPPPGATGPEAGPQAAPDTPRPTTPPPEPARPDAGAQKSGAPAALPPAPAEKTAPPISTK